MGVQCEPHYRTAPDSKSWRVPEAFYTLGWLAVVLTLTPMRRENIESKRNMGHEDIVVRAVVNYFDTPRFKRFSIEKEYPIQIGSYRMRADVALIDKAKPPAAIVECKRSSYEGDGQDQLESYLNVTGTQLGVFANETDPDAWRFYKNRGKGHFDEIDRSRFESQLNGNVIKRLGRFLQSLLPNPPEPDEPPRVPPDPPPVYPNPSHISHIPGDSSVQNDNNTDFDPSLNGKPYYNEASGFHWAANHHGMGECVPQHVKQIISNEELEIKTTHEQLQAKMERLVDEQSGLAAQKRESEQEVGLKSKELSKKKEELAGLEVQLQAPTEPELSLPSAQGAADDTKTGKQSRSSFIFGSIFPVFATVALLGLLCFLFIFYSSAGDKAFTGSTAGSSVDQLINEIVNPHAFFKAWQTENVFVIIFPFIFLVLAIVTHLSIEHKQRLYLLVLLVATFSLDTIIAVKISKGVYDEKVIRGLIDPEIEKWTIFDLNILAVILLGFGVSLLLSYGFYWTLRLWREVGSLRRQSKEQERRAVQIEDEKVQRNVKIAILKTEMGPFNEKIKHDQQRIDRNQKQIEEVLELQNKRFVNRHQIESRVSQFLKGWCRFIVHSGATDASSQINKVKQVAAETIQQYYEGSQGDSYQV